MPFPGFQLCRSSAKKARRQLLERFEYPTHQEGARVLARGIYLFFDGKEATRENAFYVGVGNDVPKRLTIHLSATSHQQSSLLYLLMKRHLPEEELWEVDEENGKRSPKKREALFREHRKRCREMRDHLLDHCFVVIHPAPDIATLHVLKALAALEFRNGSWNSFRPH